MRSPALTLAMESSKTTSKTSSLKALLLRAWRERWSDLQWGINIKTILPRGVSGDVYNLADCILQQAVVGSGANQLVLSYLKHSLSAQLVSYGAVLQRISKFDQFQKSHCIMSLLEFLEAIQAGVTCRGKPEESLLSTAILSIVTWLLQVFHHCLSKNLPANNPVINNVELLDKSATLLSNFIKNEFMLSMICLAKYNDKDQYAEAAKKCYDIESLLKVNNPKLSINVEECLQKIITLEVDTVSDVVEPPEPITYCVQALLAVEVIHNPSCPINVLVSQLLMIKRLKGYSMARLYCEIMRACWLSLNDVISDTHESQWGAFTFIKVPHIFHQLHLTVKGGDEKLDYSQDVVDAIELFLQHAPLLGIMDAKCSCNCLECLLNEFVKVSLVNDKHVKYFKSKRENYVPSVKLKSAVQPNAGIPIVITRAEPLLGDVLKTLNTDKIQESLLGMLHQVLTGKSFELILSVAIVEGKLKAFVSRLIKFNESAKQQVTGDMGKATQTKAVIFDVSFLMLCSIVQKYGSDIVFEGDGDSFFEQWVKNCMVEKGHPKSPDQILKLCDRATVDALLQEFNSGDGDFKTLSQVKWHEVCLNIPGVMKEVLLAWEQGALSANDVKRIIDAMRQRMCCLPLVATAWLCSYMQIVHQDTLLKPMNILQQFLTQPSPDDGHDKFKERCSLMCEIIRNMQYDVLPPVQNKTKIVTIGSSIVSTQPIYEQLQQVWTVIQHRGWIGKESSNTLKCLLSTGGAVWFVMNIVKEIVKFRYQDDLDKAVDLAFAVFHLDIENCALALLSQVLPQYLYNKILSEWLVEPQSGSLAKLSVYCIFALVEFNLYSSPMQPKKRSRSESEDEMPTKLLRLSDGDPQATYASAPSQSKPTITLKLQLQNSLKQLFQIFQHLTERDGYISEHTYLIFQFLKYIVTCGKDRSSVVLQFLPNTLIPYLLRALPELFTCDLLLKLYDITTVAGRHSIARDLCMLRNFHLRNLK